MVIILIFLFFTFSNIEATRQPVLEEQKSEAIPEAPPLTPPSSRPPSPVKHETKEEKQALGQFYNRAVILIDPKHLEWVGTSKSFTKTVATLFYEKSTPFIASTSLIANFYYYIDEGGKEYLRELEEDRDIAGAIKNLRRREAMMASFAFIEPRTEDWLIFAHKDKSLLLFIPRNYLKVQTKRFDDELLRLKQYEQDIEIAPWSTKNPKTGFAEEKATVASHINKIAQGLGRGKELFVCGFDPKYFDRILRFSQLHTTILKHFPEEPTRIDSKRVIAQLMQCMPKRANSLGKMLLWLGGHGRAATELESENAVLAGLTFDDFDALLNAWSTKYEVAFLFCSTCYVGGFNQKLLEDRFRNINLTYFFALAGINDRSVTRKKSLTFYTREKRLKIRSDVDWAGFFDGVTNLLTARKKIINPWGTIFSKLAIDNWFMRFPGSEKVFTAQQQGNPNRLVLSAARAQAHELTSRPIHAEDKSLVLVYPRFVGVPLFVGPDTVIACMYQPAGEKKIEEKGQERKVPISKAEYKQERQHYFFNIQSQAFSLRDFFQNILSYFGKHPLTVFIKNLTCTITNYDLENGRESKYAEMKNVVISGTLPGQITINFTWHDQGYEFNKKIEADEIELTNKFVLAQPISDRNFDREIGPSLRQKVRKKNEQEFLQEFNRWATYPQEQISLHMINSFKRRVQAARDAESISHDFYEELAKKLDEKEQSLMKAQLPAMHAKEKELAQEIEAKQQISQKDYDAILKKLAAAKEYGEITPEGFANLVNLLEQRQGFLLMQKVRD